MGQTGAFLLPGLDQTCGLLLGGDPVGSLFCRSAVQANSREGSGNLARSDIVRAQIVDGDTTRTAGVGNRILDNGKEDGADLGRIELSAIGPGLKKTEGNDHLAPPGVVRGLMVSPREYVAAGIDQSHFERICGSRIAPPVKAQMVIGGEVERRV